MSPIPTSLKNSWQRRNDRQTNQPPIFKVALDLHDIPTYYSACPMRKSLCLNANRIPTPHVGEKACPLVRRRRWPSSAPAHTCIPRGPALLLTPTCCATGLRSREGRPQSATRLRRRDTRVGVRTIGVCGATRAPPPHPFDTFRRPPQRRARCVERADVANPTNGVRGTPPLKPNGVCGTPPLNPFACFISASISQE